MPCVNINRCPISDESCKTKNEPIRHKCPTVQKFTFGICALIVKEGDTSPKSCSVLLKRDDQIKGLLNKLDEAEDSGRHYMRQFNKLSGVPKNSKNENPKNDKIETDMDICIQCKSFSTPKSEAPCPKCKNGSEFDEYPPHK